MKIESEDLKKEMSLKHFFSSYSYSKNSWMILDSYQKLDLVSDTSWKFLFFIFPLSNHTSKRNGLVSLRK